MTPGDILALLLEQNACGGGSYVREHRFDKVRSWRFDFAWPDVDPPLALELEGGVFTNGRHTRGMGFIADMEKYNAAVLMGWRLLRVSTWDLETRPAYIVDVVQRALGR